MNQNQFFSFRYHILFFFTFFCLEKKVLAEDTSYTICKVPVTCGNLEINFPFYIAGQKDPICGHPGFELSCQNNETPILTLPDGNNLTVQEILYQNQSIRVSNSIASDSGESNCILPIKNTTIPPDRFWLAPNNEEVVLLSGCNLTDATNDLLQHQKNCPELRVDDSVLAMLLDDPVLGNASAKCKEAVGTPVDVEGGITGRVEDMLRRGFVMRWIASDCSDCEESGGRCGFDSSTYLFKCFCSDRPHSRSCFKGNFNWQKLVIGISCGIIGVIIVFIYCIRRRKARKYVESNTVSQYSGVFRMKKGAMRRLGLFMATTKNDYNIEAFIRNYGTLAPKRYNSSDVKKMTNSYKEKLGRGGYGEVYKGNLRDGQLVAVKVLNASKGKGEEFINEVASISRTSHVNVVTLVGFCLESNKRALIYEFMPNGSLEKFISKESNILGWKKLYDISLGIARGLEYLHRGCNTRILHLDIKPQNILLDEEFLPKISDFGLSKLCTEKDSIVSMLEARGTIGYIAPEIFSRNFGAVSHKSDVYSYGMMVLEMVGGKKSDRTGVSASSEYFPDWIYRDLEVTDELEPQGLNSNVETDTKKKMILVALWCIQIIPSNRPSINKVIEMLEGSVEALQIPPKPYFSSPPRPIIPDSTATSSFDIVSLVE